jgi:hypothetical protein
MYFETSVGFVRLYRISSLSIHPLHELNFNPPLQAIDSILDSRVNLSLSPKPIILKNNCKNRGWSRDQRLLGSLALCCWCRHGFLNSTGQLNKPGLYILNEVHTGISVQSVSQVVLDVSLVYSFQAWPLWECLEGWSTPKVDCDSKVICAECRAYSQVRR